MLLNMLKKALRQRATYRLRVNRRRQSRRNMRRGLSLVAKSKAQRGNGREAAVEGWG